MWLKYREYCPILVRTDTGLISQEGKANRDDSVCTENLVDGKIIGEGKLEKRKKKSLSEFIINIFLNSMVNI